MFLNNLDFLKFSIYLSICIIIYLSSICLSNLSHLFIFFIFLKFSIPLSPNLMFWFNMFSLFQHATRGGGRGAASLASFLAHFPPILIFIKKKTKITYHNLEIIGKNFFLKQGSRKSYYSHPKFYWKSVKSSSFYFEDSKVGLGP